MLKFLKSILKSLIVSILSFVIIVSLIMLIAVSSSNSEKEVVVKENSILEITLSNPIVDRSSDFDFNINNISIRQHHWTKRHTEDHRKSKKRR